MSVVGLIIDGTVVVLLGVTVVYCMQLNKKLRALHMDQGGLRDVVAALDRATERAQMSLSELKSQGSSAALDLKAERERAAALLEELKMMVTAADRVADRLSDSRPPAPSNEPRQPIVREPARDMPSGDMIQALRQAR